MNDPLERAGRRLAPVALAIWPSLANPAWRSAGARRIFGERLHVSLAPSRVLSKLQNGSVAPLRRRFLVDGLDGLPTESVTELYTYRDMEDIARHGTDWRATRLGQWLKAALDAGRSTPVRGALITNEAEIEAYYRGYLTMFQSLRADGYRYDGDDHMCFGIGAAGNVMLIRRGTHRLAAAQILGLPRIAGKVTHIDRAFAERAVAAHPGMRAPDAIMSDLQALFAA